MSGIEGTPLEPVYCPFNGRYRMTYNINDGRESTQECPQPTSTLSNCPRGNALIMAMQRCSFGDFSEWVDFRESNRRVGTGDFSEWGEWGLQ